MHEQTCLCDVSGIALHDRSEGQDQGQPAPAPLQHDPGDYVAAPDTPGHPSQCDEGIVSSATVLDVSAISDYLERQENMPVYDILVVNPTKKRK